MTTPWTQAAPELFRPEQLLTQIVNGVELHRTVVEVGETYVAVTTPAAPRWGISYFGRQVPDGDPSGDLLELLPPNVGLLHRRGLPRTNRALVRALGTILVAQQLSNRGVTVGCTERLDAPLAGAHVLVPATLDHNYVHELLLAYLPYAPMDITVRTASTQYAASRLIIVSPGQE